MTLEENLKLSQNSKTETKSQSDCDIPRNYKEKCSAKVKYRKQIPRPG